MKKELGTIQALFPMPVAEERVLDEKGKVDPGKLDAAADGDEIRILDGKGRYRRACPPLAAEYWLLLASASRRLELGRG